MPLLEQGAVHPYNARRKMTHTGAIVVAALLGAGLGTLGCSGASGPAGLAGLWRTKHPPRHPFRCRTWVRFHADGTLETNLTRSRCYAARLMTYAVRAPFLELARGRARYHCRFDVRRGRLKLACGKRRVPPDFSHAVVFHRRPVARRGARLADLAGTWQMRFFGYLSRWTISPNGQLQLGPGRTTRLVLVPGHTPLRLQVQVGAGGPDRCIYRVGAFHLTLCCAGRRGQPGAYPPSFAGCRFPLVFVRK
jgi:hypothetical protein